MDALHCTLPLLFFYSKIQTIDVHIYICVCVCIHRRIERTNKCLVSLSLWTITFRSERERREGDDERQFVHFFFAFVFWFTSREKQKKNDDVVGHFQSSRLPNSQRVEFEVCVCVRLSHCEIEPSPYSITCCRQMDCPNWRRWWWWVW